MKLNLRYFASIRETLGLADEVWQSQATDVDGLLTELRARGEAYAEALAADRPVRVAINQVMARGNTALPDGAEVGLFPPVTGG